MSGLEPIVPSLTIPRSLDLSRRQPRAHAFGGPGGQVVSIDPDRAAWGERPAVQGTLRQAAGLAMYAGSRQEKGMEDCGYRRAGTAAKQLIQSHNPKIPLLFHSVANTSRGPTYA